MLEFKDIKQVIKRACRAINFQSSNINDKFGFTISAERVENGLKEKSDLHVIALAEITESFVPEVDDMQLISEYIHKREEFNDIFNGSTQVAFLMLYSDQEGTMRPTSNVEGEEPQPIPDDELFNSLNVEVDPDLVKFIVTEYPVYRVMIVRRFNWKKDKFEYSVYFRSNFNMITYIKELKNADKEETSEEIEIAEEETQPEGDSVDIETESSGEEVLIEEEVVEETLAEEVTE